MRQNTVFAEYKLISTQTCLCIIPLNSYRVVVLAQTNSRRLVEHNTFGFDRVFRLWPMEITNGQPKPERHYGKRGQLRVLGHKNQ